MKKLLLITASLLSTSSILCEAARADLGSAEDGLGKKTLSGTIFDAWCGDNKNTDCKVKFENGRLIVNGGSGITAEQVTSLTMNHRIFAVDNNKYESGKEHGHRCMDHVGKESYAIGSCQVHFWIEYKDSSGNTRNALIRLKRKVRANQLEDDLEAWSGIKLREHGSSGFIAF